LPRHHRADLDAIAHELRRQGLTYSAIAERLETSHDMAMRRVIRHERTLREQAREASQPQSSSE
jgi:orotate phosphoribosyltransferase-like protein